MLEQYVIKQNKKLRMGYTTGSCAAAASKAAAEMLLSGKSVSTVSLMTPKGILLELHPDQQEFSDSFATCCIYKDGGDDPDATNGIAVFSRVEFGGQSFEDEITVLIDGGTGVGRVTLPGLDQPVGNAAINHVPREMITKSVRDVCERFGFAGTIKVTISVPVGEEIAKKTFNPRLGIVGGISILGTSGIVEPMSETALLKSIEVEMNVLKHKGNRYIVVIPGNYGSVFSKNELGVDMSNSLKCSNFIGETIDYASALEFDGILFIGHIGKFVKLSGGIMNTHSRNADCRMELIMTAALMAGADTNVLKEIMNAGTTDEGIRILRENEILEPAMKYMMEKIAFYLDHRCLGSIRTEAIVFSNVYGILGKTKGADELLSQLMVQ